MVDRGFLLLFQTGTSTSNFRIKSKDNLLICDMILVFPLQTVNITLTISIRQVTVSQALF